MEDADVLALTIWGEARGEPVEGQIAVGQVIANRLRMGRWGHTLTAVCQAPKQFSCWNAGHDPNHLALMAYLDRMVRGEHIQDASLRQADWIAEGIIGHSLLDNTKGATHYHALAMDPLPKWAVGQEPCARVGHHLFYRGIK